VTLHSENPMGALPRVPPLSAVQKTVLIVGDHSGADGALTTDLETAGLIILRADNGKDALAYLQQGTPDLIVSDLDIPEMDGLELLGHVRSDRTTRSIPLIFMAPDTRISDSIRSLSLGADDYMLQPVKSDELLARIRARLERPTIPLDQLREDRPSGLLSLKTFLVEVEAERQRVIRMGHPAIVAHVRLKELPDLHGRHGAPVDVALARQVGEFMAARLRSLDLAARTPDGDFLLLLTGRTPTEARRELHDLSRILVNQAFNTEKSVVRVTPMVGYSQLTKRQNAQLVLDQASIALEFAIPHLDLEPVLFQSEMLELDPKPHHALPLVGFLERLRLPVQLVATFAIGWGLPFLFYMSTASSSVDISGIIYLALVAMLFITATLIWVEGVLSLKRIDPPLEPQSPYPQASAIIAAYLPNEAATIVETVEGFLKQDYPGPLQVILAYNTPRDLAIEEQLRAISVRDPRFVMLRVKDSHSKAQNVNAALSVATGVFTGIFDADHHPDMGSFARAWRWLSNKADVVQGRCLIRNGKASWVAKMVAVEFEQIYAVSHPGRARMHGFGIFGGSNGYWKTDLLRQTRMHGFMMTEDIDSSLRVLEQGGCIITDPWLISRELAPLTFRCLVHQRLRWAQGWLQASVRDIWPMMRSKKLTVQQKLGAFHLLAWREVFPWIAMQMVPLIAFWSIRAGGIFKLDWLIPIFVFFTLFIMATGPGQLLFTWNNADPEIKKNKGWFWSYLIMSMFMFAALKNILARVAVIKEVLKERAWRITSRNPFATVEAEAASFAEKTPITLRGYTGPETLPNGSASVDGYLRPKANGLHPSSPAVPPTSRPA
jgi:cellulose synthase/poly-beta-1,6-N-acetylglucosamine synthase-like glycosyltransferase/CheY-like chemotaxis protein